MSLGVDVGPLPAERSGQQLAETFGLSESETSFDGTIMTLGRVFWSCFQVMVALLVDQSIDIDSKQGTIDLHLHVIEATIFMKFTNITSNIFWPAFPQ